MVSMTSSGGFTADDTLRFRSGIRAIKFGKACDPAQPS